jgi:hypothetical protein
VPLGPPPVRVLVPLLATIPLALVTLWWNPAQHGVLAAWVELFAWTATVVATVAATALAPRLPLAAVAAAGAVLAAVAVYAVNWAAIEPRSYFALHRPLFAGVAGWVRDGAPQEPGAQVPLRSRPVAPDGARIVGRDGERPAVLLPQQGSPDGGYVFFDGDPDATVRVDLGGGRQERLVDGLYLGSGWWWF